MDDKKVLEGVWGRKSDTTWEFFVSENFPDDCDISAVMGIPYWDNKIVLVKTKRGWEIPGGHIEDDEDINGCLERELGEEVGAYVIESKKPFGYRKISNPERKISATEGRSYPKTTIVLYYLVRLGALPTGANAEDAFDSRLVDIDDVIVQESHDKDIILIGNQLIDKTQ